MNWEISVALHVVFFVIFNQFYKIATRKMVKAGALTITLQLLASFVAALCIPFMEFKISTDIRVWGLLGLSLIFYTINDRLNTTVRSGLEASSFGIISQLSTFFMTILGFLFFNEEFVFLKLVGALLILIGNVVVFYEKKQGKPNKYIILGIIANLFLTAALFLDANICDQFNLGFYMILTLGMPALLIMIFERINLSDLKAEFNDGDKKAIIITAVSWTFGIIFQLLSFQFGKAEGKISVVVPLMSLSVILNVIIGYIFLKEKNHILKKIIAAAIVLLGIFFINL